MTREVDSTSALRRLTERVEVLFGDRGAGADAAVRRNELDATIAQAVQAALVDAGILAGFGAPEGNVAAKVGAIYRRRDGGATTTLYVKTSGGAGATGWTAK